MVIPAWRMLSAAYDMRDGRTCNGTLCAELVRPIRTRGRYLRKRFPGESSASFPVAIWTLGVHEMAAARTGDGQARSSYRKE
eukprot:6120491-Prymnesium_polylepis.1